MAASITSKWPQCSVAVPKNSWFEMDEPVYSVYLSSELIVVIDTHIVDGMGTIL